MKEQIFNGKETILVVIYLTELKSACDSSRIQKGAAVWLLKDFMTFPALAAIKAQLTLSSNDENKYEGPLTS